jgi:hypothetical protein
MSDLAIPRALDRHLVSATHAAATAGDFALGAFDAVVEQIAGALREQGASPADVEAALHDAFAGLSFPHQRSVVGARYSRLEARAVSVAVARLR